MAKISVILSVRNQKYLTDAVKSILNQTYRNFEFIIVNDGPISLIIPKDPRILIINNHKNLGLTKSLNKGLKKAKGEYIARIDADDISYPNRFEEQISYLEKNPNIALVGSWVNLINDNNKLIKLKKLPTSYHQIKSNLIKANQFYHPTLMIRKNVLDKLGFYDEKFVYSQDYELVLRIASKYPVSNISKPLLDYRVNSKHSISYDRVKKQAYYALLCRIKAILNYGYPKLQLIYIIKPLISFLTPKPILLFIYRNFFFKHEA